MITASELGHSYLHIVEGVLCEVQPSRLTTSIDPKVVSIACMLRRAIEKGHICGISVDTAEIDFSIIITSNIEPVAGSGRSFEVAAIDIA